MAVIAAAATDVGRDTTHWQVPPDVALNESPIPRGLRNYGGSLAIAALGAGDETNVNILLQFPSVFVYQPKSFTISFMSDDITSEFGNIGMFEYQVGGVSAALGTRKDYEMISAGQAFRAAVNSIQTYHPTGDWRQWIMANEGDQIAIYLADMSGDASTAGDVAWTGQFWEYDIEQCFKWPVNTPQPTIAY